MAQAAHGVLGRLHEAVVPKKLVHRGREHVLPSVFREALRVPLHSRQGDPHQRHLALRGPVLDLTPIITLDVAQLEIWDGRVQVDILGAEVQDLPLPAPGLQEHQEGVPGLGVHGVQTARREQHIADPLFGELELADLLLEPVLDRDARVGVGRIGQREPVIVAFESGAGIRHILGRRRRPYLARRHALPQPPPVEARLCRADGQHVDVATQGHLERAERPFDVVFPVVHLAGVFVPVFVRRDFDHLGGEARQHEARRLDHAKGSVGHL